MILSANPISIEHCCYEIRESTDKTCVINDPLGQPTARPVVQICFVLLDFGRTNKMREYLPLLYAWELSESIELLKFILTLCRP